MISLQKKKPRGYDTHTKKINYSVNFETQTLLLMFLKIWISLEHVFVFDSHGLPYPQ